MIIAASRFCHGTARAVALAIAGTAPHYFLPSGKMAKAILDIPSKNPDIPPETKRFGTEARERRSKPKDL